jgi:hypothetical protein
MTNATTWVHVFEEDTPDGAVYRPADDNIPLSRRPRERLALSDDGTARVYTPGPDDRFIEHPAEWKQEGDNVVVRTTAKGAAPSRELVIVERTPKRLVVRRR